MVGAVHNYDKAQIKQKKFKRCVKCKENHPIEWFGIDLERTDGRSNKCSKLRRNGRVE